MERVGAINDARSPGGGTRKFERRLDGLGSGIGKEDLVEVRDVAQQALGQDAGQR